MARARYKIGTFVKVAETSENPALYGAVEEIRMTCKGIQYKVSGEDDAINEDEIETGYREMVKRESKPRSAKGKSKKAQSESRASA